MREKVYDSYAAVDKLTKRLSQLTPIDRYKVFDDKAKVIFLRKTVI